MRFLDGFFLGVRILLISLVAAAGLGGVASTYQGSAEWSPAYSATLLAWASASAGQLLVLAHHFRFWRRVIEPEIEATRFIEYSGVCHHCRKELRFESRTPSLLSERHRQFTGSTAPETSKQPPEPLPSLNDYNGPNLASNGSQQVSSR